MSRLEDAILAGRFVVTAELLTVNTGGLDAVHTRFALTALPSNGAAHVPFDTLAAELHEIFEVATRMS